MAENVIEIGQLEKSTDKPYSAFERSNRYRYGKKRGKWTKSNKFVGKKSICDASLEASRLSGGDICDLHLPLWCEVYSNWRSCEWMNPDDVVFRMIICLLCKKRIPEPAFLKHMGYYHSEEEESVTLILKRLNEVRLSRFLTQAFVSSHEIVNRLHFDPSDEQLEILVSFLKSLGIVVTEDQEVVHEKPNLVQKFHEEAICGIPASDAQDIADVMCEETGALPEIFFGALIATTTAASGALQKNYLRLYCYYCSSNVSNLSSGRLEKHLSGVNHLKLYPDADRHLLSRMHDVRLMRFYSNNPLAEVTVTDLARKCGIGDANVLKEFLQELGFVVCPLNLETECFDIDGNSAPPICKSSSGRSWDSDSEIGTDHESCSEFSAETRSYCSSFPSTSTSLSSRTSSNYSTTSGALDGNIPFFVLNQIRNDHRIEHTILDLESRLELSTDELLNKPEYMFLMGLTMFSIVVSNGCKLAALHRLQLGDIDGATDLRDSSLKLVGYKMKSTCTSYPIQQWLVIEQDVWRLIQLYQEIRLRLSLELNVSSTITKPSHQFFVYHSMKPIKASDVDYPLNQFLRMCGVDFKLRARNLTAAVNALVVRDFRKTSPEYALSFYNQLMASCEKQAELLSTSEASLTIDAINVQVKEKERKDKGQKRGSVGPQESTLAKWAADAKIPLTNRRYFKRARKEVRKMKFGYDDDDNYKLSDEEDREIKFPPTPERSDLHPDQAFERTPSPTRFDNQPSFEKLPSLNTRHLKCDDEGYVPFEGVL